MCGIAGIIDLSGSQTIPLRLIRRMGNALTHRGPDEMGEFRAPGIGFISRRLSIQDVAHGHQPMFNETREICTVFNGEIYDHEKIRADLQARGHQIKSRCDTELLPHLWEDHQEQFLDKLNGQFGLAIHDSVNRTILLARDRFGICPLYWAEIRDQDRRLIVFASEIKALIASGLIDPKPDLRGIDCLFSLMAVPGPSTCFEGVNLLLPGHYLKIKLGHSQDDASLEERAYWSIDFPDKGQEYRGESGELVDKFESLLLGSVDRRLKADVPVAAFLSGGVDSGTVVALAKSVRGRAPETFTSKILNSALDESEKAARLADFVDSQLHYDPCGTDDIVNGYQNLIVAAEAPVVDTACSATQLLARRIHNEGFKVSLCGQGADELLAGYPWFKVERGFSHLERATGSTVSSAVLNRLRGFLGFDEAGRQRLLKYNESAGGSSAFLFFFSLMNLSRSNLYSSDMHRELESHDPFAALQPDLERMQHWHPLNRSIYWGMRIFLAGHLMSAKGDRVSMSNSVEVRYPFLDNDVFDFLAGIHPDWKLKGFQDKYLLRLVAERWIPKDVAWRRKAMFRAPLNSFFLDGRLPYVDQLLSEESIRKTGYFDYEAVKRWRESYPSTPKILHKRDAVEMGLVGALSTQLWHHTYIDPSLADLPDWTAFCSAPDTEETEPVAEPEAAPPGIA